MRLSQLLNKNLYTNKTPRGISVGVAFSLKNCVVKQLLCSSQPPTGKSPRKSDFAINVSAISAVSDGISLTHIRPTLPKPQAKLFLNLPVYSYDGVFLGNLIDGEMENFILIRLFTDRNEAFPPLFHQRLPRRDISPQGNTLSARSTRTVPPAFTITNRRKVRYKASFATCYAPGCASKTYPFFTAVCPFLRRLKSHLHRIFRRKL